MRTTRRWRTQVRAAIVTGFSVAAFGVAAQPRGETFTATASVKSPGATASAPLVIRIDHFVSDAERERVMQVVKANDAAATRQALARMDDIGFIELGQRRTPIKFAYARPSGGGGRLITVVTAQPILFLGGAALDAKPRAGFDLALALLVLDERDAGEGELAPAAKVRLNDFGAIVTDEYGSEVVRLTGIARSK